MKALLILSLALAMASCRTFFRPPVVFDSGDTTIAVGRRYVDKYNNLTGEYTHQKLDNETLKGLMHYRPVYLSRKTK